MWEWLDDALQAGKEFVDDGLKVVNDLVDKYIWDTDEDEAALESWTRDTFNIPDQEGKGFISEVADKIYDWGADALRAGQEALNNLTQDTDYIYDPAKRDNDAYFQNATDAVDDVIKDTEDDAVDAVAAPAAGIGAGVGGIVTIIEGLQSQISITLEVGEPSAWAAIANMPRLLTQWVKEFKGFFVFDAEEYQSMLKKAQDATQKPKVGL